MPAKNTTNLLQKLRALMTDASYVGSQIQAYIVPSGDAHLSEYIANADERRLFITGFDGSAGTAVITDKKALLWTDGRYYLQATAQMDTNWTLMKDGLPDTPSQAEWLCQELSANSRVGVDPFLMGEGVWKGLCKKLKSEGISLVPISHNLIDAVWQDKPSRPLNPAFVLPLQFAGKSWEEKVSKVRAKMTEKKAVVMVISMLDDIAWLLNLRGNDISFNPVFFSYILLTQDELMFFIDERKLTNEVKAHLKSDKVKVTVKPYESVLEELKKLGGLFAVGKFWVSDKTNYALVSAVPKERRLADQIPIPLMKCLKNDVEVEGMRRAHIKDAAALCDFFSWLEKEVPQRQITEIEAADKSEEFRKMQADYVSLSFDTISAVGSNGAIIHYKPSPETNKVLTDKELFLLDSGAQYLDGTTDITRTIHLGTPTQYEKECFTRVLKGHIALCKIVFPNGVKGLQLDVLARKPLWEVGLDYLHGTGHGVGSFLNVHEGPCFISTSSFKYRPDDEPLEINMALSDEPGYYEDGKFGIRIENLMVVVGAKTEHNYREKGFLTFDPVTLVPIQAKLIIPSMLSSDELEWLNRYHKTCLELVGPELQKNGRKEAYDWLVRESKPITA